MASSSSAQPPSPETCQNAFERGVALSLHLWDDMSFAVQNNMGGGDSADKRDWAAGAVAELFPAVADVIKFHHESSAASTAAAAAAKKSSFPAPEDLVQDVEERLLDIMLEEFETAVQDDTAFDVAERIVGLWTQCCRGRLADVDALTERWQARKGKSVSGMFKQGEDQDQDTDWDDTDDDGEDDDEGDDEMDDAPALVAEKREKTPPEVDEDGFTKVTRKKK
ncbi:hypothetical protein MAPG_11770 [Magnaporthiopsis poae ATCC 64411]|uniref:Pre-rRNA-processing protein TSR2 n=1 Tax=Magnaporthiopsis poae (strain ATCC 64411 / 73-15) TaxID=644358 RepID=A0A0C4EG50_MAGP6|nr:hypothetical protein MAPG_11770 [Magnaporthiopsis poae ATCC 64411]